MAGGGRLPANFLHARRPLSANEQLLPSSQRTGAVGQKVYVESGGREADLQKSRFPAASATTRVSIGFAGR